jgi:hypothetical protein
MLAHPSKERDETRSSREVITLLLVIHSTLPDGTTRRGQRFWMLRHGKSVPVGTETLILSILHAWPLKEGKKKGSFDALTRVRLGLRCCTIL